MQNIKLKKKAALISLVIGFMMFFGKTGAYLLTHSAAVLSDALESVVHIFATSFAFYSLFLSVKPPDTEHPYGHGKIEFFSAGFEGALIIIAAFSIIYYAVDDIITGPKVTKLDIGAAIIFTASAVNLILGLYLIRVGRMTNSIILIADGRHVLTDAYTSIVAFAALVLVLFTNVKIIDPVSAILIALNILRTGYKLIRQSVGGLMNEMDNGIIDNIAATLQSARDQNRNLIDVHRMRYWTSGDKYYIDFHLTLPYYLNVDETHSTVTYLEEAFRKTLSKEPVELLVHTDACTPHYCAFCRKDDCSVRGEKYSKDITWDAGKILAVADLDPTE